MKKTFIFLFLFLFIFTSFSLAQEDTNTVKTGTIRGQTFSGAVVYLEDKKILVGDDNLFSFDNIEYGKYTIKIVHEDYYSYKNTIELNSDVKELGFIDLPSSKTVKESEEKVYKNKEDGQVYLTNNFYGSVEGKTVEGATVRLDDKEIKVTESNKFSFNNLKVGNYMLVVTYQDKTVEKEIEIKKGETTNLGEISFDGSNESDTVDISDPTELDLSDEEEEKEGAKENELTFSNITFSNELSFLWINYNRSISGEQGNTSKFKSKGFREKINFSQPFEVKVKGNTYPLFIDTSFSYIQANTAKEIYYDGSFTSDYHIVDHKTIEYSIYGGYNIDFDKLGHLKTSIGYLNYTHTQDKSILDGSSEYGSFNREYRNGGGISFRGNLIADFSYMNDNDSFSTINNYIDFRKLGFDLDFSYTQSLVDYSDSRHFTTEMLRGNRIGFDAYLTYSSNLNYKVGYTYTRYFVSADIEKDYTFPTTTTKYKGLTFLINFKF